MAFTAFNPSDIASGTGYAAATLTNSNLTCSNANNNNNQTVNVVADALSLGRYYLECTLSAGASKTFALGVITAAASRELGAPGGSVGALVVQNAGFVDVNGTSLTAVNTFETNGNVVCFAFDFDTRLVWIRVNNGNWNNSGTANPVTGVGGRDISALTGALKFFVESITFSSPPVTCTINTGATTFAEAVPAGYYPGWPSGGNEFPDPSNMLAFHY